MNEYRTAVFAFSMLFLVSVNSTIFAQDTGTHECPIGWIGQFEHVEDLLLEGKVTADKDIGIGVTEPRKVTLVHGAENYAAAFKPIKQGRKSGFWESYQAEIAAYELDKLLGLNMVPPTIERRIRRKNGSLQWWVDDCVLYKDVQGERPKNPTEWSHQLSRMKMFDILINNVDRNAQNFLVDKDWHIVLIDHSRSFASGSSLPKNRAKLPAQFDRELMLRVEALTLEDLEARLKGLVRSGRLEDLLRRRDALLAYMNDLVRERGEARVFF